MKRCPLVKWTPDLFGLANQGQTDAKNVYGTGSGYAPIKGLSAISTTALSAKAIGAISAQDSTGTTNTFAGDASKLYRLSGATWTDVSKVGGYTVSSTERWKFAQYGQRVIAAQITDPVQKYDLGSSSIFADLSGSPPQSRHIAVVRDFVVLANTSNSPQEVAWSGFNNSEQWTPGTNQSDTQTLQGGGWINGLIGGEVGYIYQERAITRMTYIGAPIIFQFDTLEEGRGLAAPGSLVRLGTMVFYYSQDGFYLKEGDAPSVPIGNQQVDDWFNAHLQPNTFTQITAGIDPVKKLVIWSFPSTDLSDTTYSDTLLIYNWAHKEWSYAKVNHEMLFQALSEGLTLEELSAIYPDLETVPLSFDDRAWTGGALYLGAFDTSHNLAAFTSDNLAATVVTGDIEPIPGKRSVVINTRPHSDTANATVLCESRERFSDSLVDTSSTSMQANGDCPLLSSGRYHRMKVDIPAAESWTFVNGVDVDAVEDGEL